MRSSFPSPLSSSGIHSRVARSGTPAFRTDIETDPEVSRHQGDGWRARAAIAAFSSCPCCATAWPSAPSASPGASPEQFTETQIDLLRTFADQAVIAIENVRLFDDVQKRSDELSEALEQQTATSEVLSVISSSPGDLQPVFESHACTMRRSICDAHFGIAQFLDGEIYPWRCTIAPPGFADRQGESWSAAQKYGPSRASRLQGGSFTLTICGRSSAYSKAIRPRSVAARLPAPAPSSCADAQGRQACRRISHLPPGGSPLHRQADRSGDQLRRAGRHRHREHAAAQRAARVARAADGHRRRAQGHQPLDLRSADGARHAGRIVDAALRGPGFRHFLAQMANISVVSAHHGPIPVDFRRLSNWSRMGYRPSSDRPRAGA